MVRHGKLSKGCLTCRNRKIKCDQATPSCTQCRRAGWVCPQYGDAGDRVFQHRTAFDFIKSEQPGKAKSQIYPRATEQGTSSRGAESLTTWTVTTTTRSTPFKEHSQLRISPGIIPLAKDRAISFFMLHHVLPNSTAPRGYFEYLSTFCAEPIINETLSTSINAVAYAVYAHTFQSPKMLKEARQYLVTAIHLVNTALSSRQEATKDHTVISIMLLSTFETITGKNQQSLKDCDLHMRGATTVLKLRGHQQLQSQTGLQIFLQICSNVLLGCLQRSVRVPAEVVELRTYAESFLDTDDPAWRLSDIVVRIAHFRSQIKTSDSLDPGAIIAAALAIDAKLCALSVSMPAQWHYNTIRTEVDSEMAYDGYYHIYPDLWVAHIWNSLRTCRLILHQEILFQLSKTQSSHLTYLPAQDMQCNRSKEVLQEMASEICATIPQHAGYLPAVTNMWNEHQLNFECRFEFAGPEAVSRQTIPTAAGIYFLLWPLLNAGQATDSLRLREWMVKRLRYIGGTTGIQQAFALATILERSERVDVWDSNDIECLEI